ncbi:DUF3726 domain-containing protein [Saccharopolyspora sp. NPDC050389]|uniref:DUF3726 domain-containing protein n=1 Tax=Saccharopolyspora sp. NPDC050389 TaxID=3155516 RepID=UPI00340E7E59
MSTREVREVALRAMRAAGASAGEAAAVANLVLMAEVQGWGGLAVLRQELDAGPNSAAATSQVHDGVLVVDADPCRGPLRLGVSVFDLVAARASRGSRADLFVRGLGFRQAFRCLALELVERVGGTTVLAEFDDSGAATAGLVCTADGCVRAADLAEFDRHLPAGARAVSGGLYVSNARGDELSAFQWPVISTTGQRERNRIDAINNGRHVEEASWNAAHRASRGFLIAEPAK